jgi:hypothetical protein
MAKKEEYKKEQVCTVASQGKTDFKNDEKTLQISAAKVNNRDYTVN